MKFNITKTAIIGALSICLLIVSAGQVQAQRSTRVLVCNERNSVSDVMRYPSQARVVKTRNGTSSFLEWNGFIGNDKGNYDLTITSDSDFNFKIFTKSRSRNSKWQRKAIGEAEISDTGNYYISEQYFTSDGYYSNGYDVAIGIYPIERQANVRFLWYTTNCAKSEPRNPTGCRIEAMGGGRFGLDSRCICNGVEVDMSRCRNTPRRFSSLNFINLLKGNYSHIDLNKQNKNYFVIKDKLLTLKYINKG